VVAPDYVGPVIEEVTAPSVLTMWGGRVATQLVSQLGTLAKAMPDLAEKLALSVWEFEEQRNETTAAYESHIFGLTSTRQQDLETARFGTAQAFPAFLSAAPETALRCLLAVINGHAAPSEPPRTTGGLPRVYRGFNLEFASGYEGLSTMAHALVALLVAATSSEDVEAHGMADRVIEVAVARLTHHQVWNYLLEAGAVNPDSLGRRLLPLLDRSDLLGHYMTALFAARLIASLSPILTPTEHADLEQSILRASDPLDTAAERPHNLIDPLLGQLDPGHVRDEAVRTRLARLASQGGPPPTPEPPTFVGGFGTYGVRERLIESGAIDEADGALMQAMETIQADLQSTTSGSADNQRAALGRLRESLPALYSILIPASSAADKTVFGEAFTLMVNGAQRLASDAEVLPGTDLGEMVFGILRAALPAVTSPGGGS
jgi:hypothetical protein